MCPTGSARVNKNSQIDMFITICRLDGAHMTQLKTLSLALCSTLAGVAPAAVFAEEQKEGFIEGSTLTVLNRNFYMNRDHRNGESSPTGNGYSEAWAQGIIGRFQSGFTQGTFGVGVDAFAMIGIKLDTGDGRNAFDVLPVDGEGRARDEYTKVGGSLKARAFDTVVNVGDVFPSTPVVAFGDSRLLPESFRGVTAVNNSISGLTLQGGRLHSMSQPVSSNQRDGFVTFYGGAVDSPWVAYFGGDYQATEPPRVS
ncbi:Outer membrane porin, partial [Pseudomonas savastanoi pv. nerii]